MGLGKTILPRRDMRRIEGTIEEIERHPVCEDYVFVTLLNENPVLFPMEKVRSVYPSALHVERKVLPALPLQEGKTLTERRASDPVALFSAFYREVKGIPLGEDKQRLFADVFSQVFREEGDAL